MDSNDFIVIEAYTPQVRGDTVIVFIVIIYRL